MPPQLKERLRTGTERIARIRELIARDAKVSVMPPVELVGEIWIFGHGIVEGCAVPLNREDSIEWGVQVPAHLAIQGNDATLRAVLVHEFAHCFYYVSDMIHRLDRGTSMEIAYAPFDPTNDHHDRDLLVNPHDWFGENDARDFIHHADQRLKTADENLSEIAEYLPVVTPDLKIRIRGSYSLDDEIVDYVRSLRRTFE